MPTIQISKIQLRRGEEGDLPGMPSSLSPLAFTPCLDTGELGFATDTGRLFIGQNSPTDGQPNFNRIDLPYQNIEVLTENSPLPIILRPVIGDNQQGFITSLPLISTGVFTTLQVYDLSGVAQDVYLDLLGVGACVVVWYFVFNSSNNPIRLGQLGIVWNPTMVGAPLLIDLGHAATGDELEIEWSAIVTGSIGDQHVALQYINHTTIDGAPDTPIVKFRLDRPMAFEASPG